MHHTSVVNSLSPWKGERDRVRGGVEALSMDLVKGVATFPPHPDPLPLGGGEGECGAGLECLIAILSSILRIHLTQKNFSQPMPKALSDCGAA